jgi:hypothetical protein
MLIELEYDLTTRMTGAIVPGNLPMAADARRKLMGLAHGWRVQWMRDEPRRRARHPIRRLP